MAAQKGFIYEENTADFLKPAGIVPQNFMPAGAGHDQPDLMIQFKGQRSWIGTKDQPGIVWISCIAFL